MKLENLKTMIWQQLGASIDMLENAILACPEQIWSDRTRKPECWYLVFHTLFWLDYYSSETTGGFAPPAPFTLDEMDPAGVLPDRVYTKEEMLTYLEYGRNKSRSAVEVLTEEKAALSSAPNRPDVGVVELFMYNLRHIQHAAAQLNTILRQEIDSAPRWVVKTEK